MTPLRAELAAVLACPRCHGELVASGVEVGCPAGHRFPVVEGVPVFTPVGTDVERRPAAHVSHQVPAHLLELFAGARTWLHLGAGATVTRHAGSIELETALFTNTDVVGDAGELPFQDASLGGVLALNVFEHLEEPGAAAAELHRVLRPGGLLVVQTAFLQPLHADPDHYFNVTESGLRRWFRAFDPGPGSVSVPENLQPAYSLSWIASDLLFHAPDATRPLLGAATLAEVAEIWRDPGARSGELYRALVGLPEHAQRALAAGFQLLTRR